MNHNGNLEIAVVTMKFPSASETFITGRLRALEKLGHSLTVYALRREAPRTQQLRFERAVDKIPTSHNSLGSSVAGVIVGLSRPRLLASTLAWLLRRTYRKPAHLVRALGILPRAFDILARLQQAKPDVVHFEWGHFPVVLARLIQVSAPDILVSISLIAYDLNTEFGGTIDVARDADVIRTQAEVNVAQISSFTGVPADRIAVVRDGVDMTGIAKLTSVAEKVRGRVVVAGRLVAEKGVDDAIRVFAKSRAAAPFATLRVLGEGPELQNLQSLVDELDVADAVEFLGHVSHGQVLHELGCAEALLHLSRTERLPNVVKEAMASDCVPITTRTAGIEELVTHGVTGFIVEHSDLTTASDYLSRILARLVDIEPITEAAKLFIYRNFDHQVNVDRLVELWRTALQTAVPKAEVVGTA